MKKVFVITGATSGIGRALCENFAQDAIVFAGYRRETAQEELLDISDNVIPFYIDMTDCGSIAVAAEFIKSRAKNIDTLINVAGCVVAGAIENLDVHRIKEQFDVNTFSHLDFTQRLLPILEGGKIINISSMASFGIFPFVGPYCASKRALDILFNSLFLETHKKIQIISVKPGVIATPLWEKSIKENVAIQDDKGEFSKEMTYMVNNARKNGKTGLPIEKVVELIEKIVNMQAPKPSYTVGFDARTAELVSRLPQDWINFILKIGMRLKGLK